jgi:hypothetical protein
MSREQQLDRKKGKRCDNAAGTHQYRQRSTVLREEGEKEGAFENMC